MSGACYNVPDVVERDHAFQVKSAPSLRLKHAANGFVNAFLCDATTRNRIAQGRVRTLNVWHVEYNITASLNRLHCRFACLVALRHRSHVQGIGEDYAFEAEVAAKNSVNNRGRECSGSCAI